MYYSEDDFFYEVKFFFCPRIPQKPMMVLDDITEKKLLNKFREDVIKPKAPNNLYRVFVLDGIYV